MATTLRFGPFLRNSLKEELTVTSKLVVFPKGALDHKLLAKYKSFSSVPTSTLDPLSQKQPSTSSVSFWETAPHGQVSYHFSQFNNELSRNMGFLRMDNLQSSLSKCLPSSGDILVAVMIEAKHHAMSVALAVTKLFPLYNRKTGAKAPSTRSVYVDFILDMEEDIDYQELQHVSDSMRMAQRLVDTPCEELHTDAFVQEALQVVESLNTTLGQKCVECKIIAGTQLQEQGFGGLWGVGKGATHLPALVILTYTPKVETSKSLAFVGKGIVFDTGGLSLKSTTNMCGMKHDMGGAAAVLGAFQAVVLEKQPVKVHALLCLAENAIGPLATRNDDILTMYSGKTVEINNTDAEGRLVLADGVAYASKHLSPQVIVDMATLTGAQMVATGLLHAGLLTSSETLEASFVQASKHSGDLVFPLLYAKDLLQSQFDSVVADMKNSVKDRTNVPSSCAGHFIESHLHPTYEGDYVHIDIAGPASAKERATGYGVGLLYEFVKLQVKSASIK